MATATERGRPRGAVAGLAARAAARSALVWAAVLGVVIATSASVYDSAYGTAADRADLARGLVSNGGIRALFGEPRNIEVVSGFVAWRTMAVFPLIAGIWGLLTATRLLRGAEDDGRWETLRAAPLTAGAATLATLLGFARAWGLMLAVTAVAAAVTALTVGDIPVGGAVYLALALTIAAPAFAAVGALAAQIAPTRREAAALAGAVFAAAFVLRVAADGSASLGWLRWLTPLGWVENLRPLAGARPFALLVLAAWTAALTWLSVRLAARRDLGAALLRRTDERAPRPAGLSAPASFTLREMLPGLVGWTLGLAFTGFVFGLVSKSAAEIGQSSPSIRQGVQDTLGRQVDIASAEGYLALVFVFVAVALALYAATHATAARAEEENGRLETLLALHVGRTRWLGGRLVVAAGACVILTLVSGVAAWAGAAVKNAGVSLPDMLETAGNALPVVALFLGLALLGFALVPRHTGAIAFGLVGAAYLWEQTGSILKAPGWVLAISPFHWLALVPSEPFDPVASGVMSAAGLLAAGLALAAFRRRDLVGP